MPVYTVIMRKTNTLLGERHFEEPPIFGSFITSREELPDSTENRVRVLELLSLGNRNVLYVGFPEVPKIALEK